MGRSPVSQQLCEPQLIMLLDGQALKQARQRNRLGFITLELNKQSLHILRAGMKFPGTDQVW